MTNFLKVEQFHHRFGIQVPRTEPGLLPADLQAFRTGFLEEELREYRDAVAAGDLVKAIDSLGDLLYVTYGTLLLHGVHADIIFQIIHEANMRKRPAEPGEGRHASDIVKPEGWQPPDHRIRDVLKLWGADV
jgi:predicted HAD superfamily Cof-like phosphohydrolase